MDDAISDVLKSIGWDTGFRLPIANAENQALERKLAHLVIKKATMAKQYDDATARYNNLSEHLKFVRQEVQQNQNLLTTYRSQLDTEIHKLKLRQAEKNNLAAEIRKMVKHTEDINERLSSKRTLLKRNLAKLEKIKAEAEWDAQAMKAWEEATKKRDEDNELLMKFSAEDKRRVVDLETKRKNLQTEVNGRKNMITQMDMDIVNYQQILMRTGKMLSELKDERNALVRQWQESVHNLKQKDVDIRRIHETIETIETKIRQTREDCEEQEAFLSNEKNANKYLEMELNDINANSMHMRKELRDTVAENAQLLNEQTAKKKQFAKVSNDMKQVQLQLRHGSQLSQHYKSRLNKLNKDMANLEEQSNDIKEQSGNAARNADLIEGMIKEAEKTGQLLARKMQTLINRQYKINTAASQLAAIGNQDKAEVCALENALSQIRKRAAAANEELIHRKQLVSDLDMKVACLEAQMGNADPDDVQDFQDMWNNKIQELEESLAQHTEIKVLLHAQILKLQKENLRLVNAISNDSNAHQLLRDRLQSLLLQIEGGIKQTKAATLRTQQQQVAENVLKLKVDKLQKAMDNEDKDIYDMQRYKIDLEATLKQSHIEVNTAKDVLFAKKKNLEEDRGRLRADLAQRNVRIQQLENKYELALGLLGKDETGEPISISTFKVRAAQNRYELQQEGDELDKKIKKTEQEIVAMENTLKIVNLTNNAFKNSLTVVDKDSADAEVLDKLQDELTTHMGLLKDKKQELFEEVEKVTELEAEIKTSEEGNDGANGELENLEDVMASLTKEENDRQEKIERASRQITMCKKRIDHQQLDTYDRELYIRQLMETNKNALNQLADFGQQYAEILPLLRTYLESKKIELPRQRTLTSTPSSDSVCSPSSSINSQRSVRAERSVAANVTSLELKFDDLPSTSSSSTSRQRDSRMKK